MRADRFRRQTVLSGVLVLLLAAAGCSSPRVRDPAAVPAGDSAQGPGTASGRAQAPVSAALTGGLARADSLLAEAVAAEAIPGAVLVVTRAGRIIHERAFGHAQLYDFGMRRLDPPRPMHASTVFDLASVTKVMATTYALMLLVDRGRIDLDAPVHAYLPEFRGARLDSITVRHLLTHSAGLVQWQPLYYRASTSADACRVIGEMPLRWGVGEGRHYSDPGFMLLGCIVARITGRTLDEFLRTELYEPLGLRVTTFLPKARGLVDFAATSHGNPYERRMVHDTAFGYRYDDDPNAWTGWRQYTLVGEVNDGNAWHAHGGVAGHAGLFSTGRELAVLINVLLRAGVHDGRRVLSAGVIERFMQRDRYGHAVGWQLPAETPAGSFAHDGFTGTYVIGVPAYDLGIVLLTNRQNLGVDARGYYPAVAVRQSVVRTILEAAAVSGTPAERPH